MKSSHNMDWISINRKEIKLLKGTLLLQGTVQKPMMGSKLSRNWQLAILVFYETTEKRSLILLKFLHFKHSEGYRGQVSHKIYKLKCVFDHQMQRFSHNYNYKD